jgi:hypothetical protein
MSGALLTQELPQDPVYITHCRAKPTDFDLSLIIPHDHPKADLLSWKKVDGSTFHPKTCFLNTSAPLGASLLRSLKGKEEADAGDTATETADIFAGIEDTVLFSAAAFCGDYIDHLLDGYSWALATRIQNLGEKGTRITIQCRPVTSDMDLYAKVHTVKV